MNIELKGDNFELSFNYKTSIIERVRQIPGRRFDGARKVWIVPTRSRVDLERMLYQIQQFEAELQRKRKILLMMFRNFQI